MLGGGGSQEARVTMAARRGADGALAGADLTRLRNELEKLIAYAGATKSVSVADVNLVVTRSPEATVFELIDAIGDRRPIRR